MTKKYINIAIIWIVSILIFYLIIFNFIKFEKIIHSILSNSDNSYVLIDKNNVNYIERKNITRITIEYQKLRYYSSIEFQYMQNDYGLYWIYLPNEFDKTQPFMDINLIIDTINIYQLIY